MSTIPLHVSRALATPATDLTREQRIEIAFDAVQRSPWELVGKQDIVAAICRDLLETDDSYREQIRIASEALQLAERASATAAKSVADQTAAFEREVTRIGRELQDLRRRIGEVLCPEQSSWSDHDLVIAAYRKRADLAETRAALRQANENVDQLRLLQQSQNAQNARIQELESACRCGAIALRKHWSESPTADALDRVVIGLPYDNANGGAA